jgi:hypothetical protein
LEKDRYSAASAGSVEFADSASKDLESVASKAGWASVQPQPHRSKETVYPGLRPPTPHTKSTWKDDLSSSRISFSHACENYHPESRFRKEKFSSDSSPQPPVIEKCVLFLAAENVQQLSTSATQFTTTAPQKTTLITPFLPKNSGETALVCSSLKAIAESLWHNPMHLPIHHYQRVGSVGRLSDLI